MFRTKRLASLTLLAAICAIGWTTHGYTSYAKWATASVDFYVNPNSADVSGTNAVAALVAGANVWAEQSNASFRFVYAGTASDTATTNDGRNVVFFRNTSNGSAIASTYSWWNSGRLLDSDIIFWDGPFTFFTGSSGCGGSNAAYIEDIAAHEFGHALGLQHSTVPGATMYSGYSTCSMAQRTIEADDIAGVEALYPPGDSNAAPTVTVLSPASATSFTEGTAVMFSGSAVDVEDGDISGSLAWTSTLDGQIGSGPTFQRVLSPGTHTITTRATDSRGVTTQVQRALTVAAATPTPPPPPPATSIVATGSGYKVKGSQRADLQWSGAASSAVDIYRDGARIRTTYNSGEYTDAINRKGNGTYKYIVCEAGTSICSNPVTVSFN